MTTGTGFLQRVRFEDKILDVIGKCNDAFGTGNIKYQKNIVADLHSLLYAIPEVDGLPGLEDEIKKIDNEVKKILDDKMIIYEKQCKAAMVPDVIEKPVLNYETEHIDKKYREILKIYAMNKLTIISKNITHL